ncbi:MAG TPA: lysozyme inhibitor LprI family protein [Elusimicrobiota bacterium]|nr:lysozyme inhibitor LprI family protein [Elusimicrobiota bacterium]
MRRRIRTLAIVLIFPAAVAGAADPFSLEYHACMDKAGGVTFDTLHCIADETKRQDARLNAAYQVLMKGLPEPRKTQLRDVQRDWIRYRKSNCDFYLDPDGGTLASVLSADCFLSATAERARELEKFNP